MKVKLSADTVRGELVRRIEEISGQDLLACYQCGRCSAGCPSADLMEILGEDRFRINGYRKSARVIEELTEAIEDICAEGRLQDIAGVGKGTAAKIEQYLKTSKIDLYEELLKKVPPQLPGLLAVAGLGPKTVSKLWKQANVTSIGQLRTALEDDPERLMQVDGVGPKKARRAG